MELVSRTGEFRKRPVKLLHCLRTVVIQKILSAPGIFGLEHANLMSPGLQLRNDAAEEVSVSVIPVGNQRMAEDRNPDLHAATSLSACRLLITLS